MSETAADLSAAKASAHALLRDVEALAKETARLVREREEALVANDQLTDEVVGLRHQNAELIGLHDRACRAEAAALSEVERLTAMRTGPIAVGDEVAEVVGKVIAVDHTRGVSGGALVDYGGRAPATWHDARRLVIASKAPTVAYDIELGPDGVVRATRPLDKGETATISLAALAKLHEDGGRG